MKNTGKRLFAALMTIIMLFSVIPTAVFAVDNSLINNMNEQEVSPDEIITSYEQLKAFAERVNGGDAYEGKLVRLDVNIALGGESNPWTAIGTSANPFKGIFDGNYHVISGLYITTGSYVGFFGSVRNGTVKNLVVKGSVKGSASVSGVVGSLSAGSVVNCANEADVSGINNVGGVVGAVIGACEITACRNSGNVSGSTGYIGGVVGSGSNSTKVTNCYNTGIVSGPATVGGVSGGHKAYTTSVENCFNAGKVIDTKGSNNNIGAVVGATRGTLTNCYYLEGTGKDNKSGVTGVSALSVYDLGSAFENGSDYPVLTWEKNISTSTSVRPAFVESTELSAQLAGYIKSAVKSTKSNYGLTSADSLLGNDSYLSGASSTSTDWMALAMGRFGYYDVDGTYCYMIDDGDGYNKYLDAMQKYVEKTYAENNGILHSVKATEWHRAVVTVKALQGDVRGFGSYNGNTIDLVADGSHNCVLSNGPGTQGINGWLWGLIALDSGCFDVPQDAKYTREKFITEILKMQLTDGVNSNEYGGWALNGYGNSSDVDITAMAIQALAPYYNDDTVYSYVNLNNKKQESKTVRQCVDEALERLSSMMNENAGFSSWGTSNVESIAQVVVALCSLGINPVTDERFITSSGKTLLDGMMQFCLSNGGFCHILNSSWNSMATDQATYALVALWRLENGMRSLYDMRENQTDPVKSAIEAVEASINEIPDANDASYKEKIKSALEKTEIIPLNERRYISNYDKLATAFRLIGGRENLDKDIPYVTGITVTSAPSKTRYFSGETFDKSGMVITAEYSNGEKEIITDYRISPSEPMKIEDDTVYIIYGVLKTAVSVEVFEKMPWSGEGTEENPFLITNSDELLELAQKVNEGKSFKDVAFMLADNVDLSDVSNWTPIGLFSSRQFDGIFDGQGYAIDNLNSTKGGLFGYVGSNAVIKNVGVASGEINCPNENFIGGVAGWSNGADFINCWNGADIVCIGYSAGIVGTVRDGGNSRISNCYNVGSITAEYGSTLGGIVGHLSTTRDGLTVNVTVENCYNAGSVTAPDTVGGIVGSVQDGHKIVNCYNSGEVTATTANENMKDHFGAVIGAVTPKNEVKNCYYDSSICNRGIGSGNDTTISKTADEMCSAAFLNLLGTEFKADKYCLVNNGYPLLSYQKTYDANDIDAVAQAISAIGTQITAESEPLIIEARKAYDELDDSLKKYVSNYSDLISSEKAKVHSFTQWITIKEPTCTQTGEQARTCSVCSVTETQIIDAKGHVPVIDEAVPATCEASGKTEGSHCSVCGKVIVNQNVIPATGHNYTMKVTKSATCTKTGVKTYTCSCGENYTETINATGHTYSKNWTIDKSATCTASGSKSHHCTRCNAKSDVTTIKALGHKTKTTITKATASKAGKIETKCTVCGKVTKTTTIAKVSTVKLSTTKYAYDGKAKTPAVTAKGSNGKTLKKGTDYTVAYSANKAIGKATAKVTFKGNYSGTKTLTFSILPANVKNLKATQTTSSVKLTWSKVSGVTGYRVYKYDTKNKKWVKVADTKNTNYTVSKLKAGTSYKYAVRAYTTVSKTTYWSASYPQLTTATKPATPILKATAGTKQATLSWNKISGATGYEIWMATKKDGKYSKITTIKKNATVKYTKKSLKKGSTYYFKVRAYKTVGGKNVYGAYSAVKSVKVK